MSARATRNGLVLALLTLLTLAVFAQVTGFEFVAYDDDYYVTANPVALGGLSAAGLRWVLTHEHGGYWAPLTALSHMLDVELYGTRPAGHHATSLALHVVDTWLVFGFLLWATGRTWPAAFVAALFAVHPLHVESVAWVSSRKDVLSTLVALAALWTYAAWVRRRGAALYLATTALVALGLAAKPMLVTLPFLFLLLDVWPLERPETRDARLFGRLVLEKLPLLALCAAAIAVTHAFLRQSDSLFPFELSLADRAANAVVSYARYLRMTVWPSGLSAIHPHPNLPGSEPWSALAVLGSAGLLALLSALALASRSRAVLVGWLWFAGTLLPVSGLVAFGLNAMAERFTYVPLIGLFVAIAYGADELVRRARPPTRVAVGALALVAVAAAALVAHERARVWRDSLALFEDATAKAPRSPIPRNNLANALAAAGRYDEAEAHYRLAAQNAPGHPAAHVNLGNLALTLHDAPEQAIAHYERALAADPADEPALRNLAVALRRAGRAGQAALVYRDLLARCAPAERAETCDQLAAALREAGDPSAAAEAYERALALEPERARSRVGLAVVRLETGELEAARALLERAVELAPELAEAHAWLGRARELQRDPTGALASYAEAARLSPEWAMPLAGEAWLRATHPDAALRDPALAARLAERAVTVSGRRDARALDAWAAACAASGDFARAVELAHEAASVATSPDEAAAIRAREELYRGSQPYRSP